MEETEVKDAYESGYTDYKKIKLKKINGIYVESFRTLKNRQLDLGNNITVISGKNGTMKSTILGLIAHPFDSPNDAQDEFGNKLKTRHSDVFYLSPEKDNEQYKYSLIATTVDDIQFEEPIRVYPRKNPNGSIRHRVTVGKDNIEGKGNFALNTCYINLKRLFPILDTNAQVVDEEMKASLAKFISEGYMKILQKEAFSNPVKVHEKGQKQTFGPGEEAKYDYKAISSGEDNIGHILSKMYAFIQYKSGNVNELQGIFCIDEIEASLHPVAQINLFNYIYNWSKNNNIQVVINTHSLYLIQYVLDLQNRIGNKEDVVLNMISTAFVSNENYNIIKNPSYAEAYKELTLKGDEQITDIYKINIICEDDVAENYLKRIVSKRQILDKLEFLHGLNENAVGNSCSSLKSLIKNGEKLLSNAIVVFDPDVPLLDIRKYNTKFINLPSEYNLPIEKEIVKYIYDLEGGAEFFRYFNKERNSFLNEFAKCDILNLNNLDTIKSDSTKKYKNWANLSGKEFNKYLTYFIKNNKGIMNDFRQQFFDIINEMYEKKGLIGIE